MAYISQDEKKALLPEINRVLKKYEMKGSVSIKHHSTLTVTLSTGRLDLIGNWFELQSKRLDRFDQITEKPTNLDVSHHRLDSKFNGECLAFLSELFDAMKGLDWYDRSDMMTDYFDVAHYVDVKVGRWNKPFIFGK
jgi:hypothetical protein